MITRSELLMRRSTLREDFRQLRWRKQRMDERLDRLAKEIEEVDLELSVESILHPEEELHRLPTFIQMEIAAEAKADVQGN